MFTKYVLCSEIYIFYSESAQMTQHVQILVMYCLFILIYFTCVLDMAEYRFCVLGNFFILYISSTHLNSINNKMWDAFVLIFKYPFLLLLLLILNYTLLSWRFRIPASQKGYEKHRVRVIKAFSIPYYPRILLVNFFLIRHFHLIFLWDSWGVWAL